MKDHSDMFFDLQCILSNHRTYFYELQQLCSPLASESRPLDDYAMARNSAVLSNIADAINFRKLCYNMHCWALGLRPLYLSKPSKLTDVIIIILACTIRDSVYCLTTILLLASAVISTDLHVSTEIKQLAYTYL